MNRFFQLVLLLSVLAVQSCDYAKPHDLLKQGNDQASLRYLVSENIHLKIGEDAVVEQAYSSGGKDATLWFRVSFKPSQWTDMQNGLVKCGYRADGLESKDIPREMPLDVKQWWKSDSQRKQQLFVLELDKRGPGGEGTWCLVDRSKGVLLVCCYTN